MDNNLVAPRAGAWIETRQPKKPEYKTAKSLPARERGLKLFPLPVGHFFI